MVAGIILPSTVLTAALHTSIPIVPWVTTHVTGTIHMAAGIILPSTVLTAALHTSIPIVPRVTAQVHRYHSHGCRNYSAQYSVDCSSPYIDPHSTQGHSPGHRYHSHGCRNYSAQYSVDCGSPYIDPHSTQGHSPGPQVPFTWLQELFCPVQC